MCHTEVIEAVRFRGKNPYTATIGLRVEAGVEEFRLEIPADALHAVLAALGKVGAVPLTTTSTVLEGLVPAARVYELQRRLPSLTRGEGVLESEFDHYA